MNREKKKQVIAIFIFLVFFGSTFAMALSYVLPSETQTKYIFDEPLAVGDEAYFFKQNIIVARVYYDEPSDTINTLDNLVNVLNQKIIVERINIIQYPEVYAEMKTKFSTDEMPMVLLRGNTEVYLNGEQNATVLLDEICNLYFEPIEECSLI